jgi:hypothetical protein
MTDRSRFSILYAIHEPLVRARLWRSLDVAIVAGATVATQVAKPRLKRGAGLRKKAAHASNLIVAGVHDVEVADAIDRYAGGLVETGE